MEVPIFFITRYFALMPISVRLTGDWMVSPT